MVPYVPRSCVHWDANRFAFPKGRGPGASGQGGICRLNVDDHGRPAVRRPVTTIHPMEFPDWLRGLAAKVAHGARLIPSEQLPLMKDA